MHKAELSSSSAQTKLIPPGCRLLVTGGAGFIGANFVQYWLAQHPQDRVVVLDALTYAGNMASLAGCLDQDNFRFVHGDIGDQDLVETLLSEEGLDTVVNFAAESHVDRSIHGPDPFVTTNVVGTHSLLKAAKKVWLDEGGGRPHRFHHVSTDEVYGSLTLEEPPFTETTAYAPNSPYSASKAASDHLVRAYHHTYGLPVTLSNCSNNYGPYQFPEKLIPLIILNILDKKPLPVYGDGRNVRDWIYVEDHNAAVRLILQRGADGQRYNVGGESERENIWIVHTLCDLVAQQRGTSAEENRALITHVKDRPGHDRRYAIDCSKIKRDLGWRQTTTFEEGLAATVRWYLSNEGWISRVKSGAYRDWLQRNYDHR